MYADALPHSDVNARVRLVKVSTASSDQVPRCLSHLWLGKSIFPQAAHSIAVINPDSRAAVNEQVSQAGSGQ
jgi:hypothetical protein